MTTPKLETRQWLAAPLGGENPQAIFRDRSPDMTVTAHESLPADVAAGLGKNCGRRVLPYRLQDRYGRDRQPRNFQTIVLENECLKAVFLPELGGRLMSLFHKPTQRELLFNNPVFQPANLALRDAWFAGGIEWNIGQFGHTYHTCAPVFAASIIGPDGSRGLRLYDFERCKGLLWQIDFHLPPGSEFLQAFTRVINPRDEVVPMYWWTNIAVPEQADVRVLAPALRSTYVDYSTGGLSYGQADLPGLPTIGGADGTYPVNLGFTSEFFFQCQEQELPWQAALDASGRGLVEASTHPLNVRKLFCWGMHQGGRRWKEFLSVPGQPYIEIQAGLAPTQQHTVPMPPRSEWTWTQVFGYLEADPAKVHGDDWNTAWQAAGKALEHTINKQVLDEIGTKLARHAVAAPIEILSAGSGWGALESARLAHTGLPPFPDAFVFPASTLGSAQRQWLSLMENGSFPEQDPSAPPGEWMIQREWMDMLESNQAVPDMRNGFALLHLGVMKIENGDEASAIAAWEESVRLWPSPWGWRNLAAAAVRRGDAAAALPLYQNSWDLAAAAGTPDVSFALEYLAALHAAGQHEQAWNFYQNLPSPLQGLDTVILLAAKIALARKDLAFVEEALTCDFSSIREGARDLTDLWFGLQSALLEARADHGPDGGGDRNQLPQPPYKIDFRVHS